MINDVTNLCDSVSIKPASLAHPKPVRQGETEQWATSEASRIWPGAVWLPAEVGLTEKYSSRSAGGFSHPTSHQLLPGNEQHGGSPQGQTCWETHLRPGMAQPGHPAGGQGAQLRRPSREGPEA